MPISGGQAAPAVVYEEQTPVYLSQANPIVDNYYVLLNENNVKIKLIAVRHTYGEARMIGVRVTVDGIEYTDLETDLAPALLYYAGRGGGNCTYAPTQIVGAFDDAVLEYEGDVLIEIKAGEVIDTGLLLLAMVEWSQRV